MGLFKIIDGLLVGTKYLAWGIGLIGMIGSVVLFFTNLSLGFASAAVFIASFFLCAAVTLLLLPEQLVKGIFAGKARYIIGGVALVIAAAGMGIVYAVCGGFPALNLLFV